MCGRIIIKKSIKIVEEQLNLEPQQNLHDFRGYNIGPGAMAPVLNANKKFEMMRFGLTPFWSKKNMLLFNARSEGDFNKENDPTYSGNKGIFQKPSFRKPIRSQRCLVFVNGFLEGPEKEKLSKPFYVFDEKNEFMALAGIWDQWVDKESGEEIKGFSILTTVSNKATAAIGHHRSPVRIPESQYYTWLKAEHLNELSPLLEPWAPDTMNAYPVNPEIKSPRSDDPDLLIPQGDALIKRKGIEFVTEFDTLGFGRKKKL
ncbi:SOS response-associated peptidase [bacterium]|nr:SOS response-associated peptidase [bacterium]